MRQAHKRIQAVMTGTEGKTLTPEAAHERNVLAITRRIHALTFKAKRFRADLAAVQAELRAKRRELRAVLQRDARVMDIAGQADAIDAADARAERKC